MRRYQSYIICTSPRSGSTLLCQLLTRSGQAGAPKSYFHSASLTSWLEYFDLDTTVFQNSKQALRAVFDTAVIQGKAGTGLFGLRLQGQSRDFLLRQLRVLRSNCDTDLARIDAEFGKPLFIHLTRRDKLAQAISYVRASQTGLWHKNADGSELERTAPPAPSKFDRDQIARQKAIFDGMERDWHGWFAQAGIDPLVVDYDRLSDAPLDVLNEILKHLDREPMPGAGFDVPTARLADATTQEWTRRFLS